jgi:hypothetical protein
MLRSSWLENTNSKISRQAMDGQVFAGNDVYLQIKKQ